MSEFGARGQGMHTDIKWPFKAAKLGEFPAITMCDPYGWPLNNPVFEGIRG